MLDLAPLNADFPMEVSFVDLTVTLASFLHPENALFPIAASFDLEVLPMVTAGILLQPENALAPIVFTLAPMIRLVIFLFFCIAFAPIEVTLYFTPSVPVTVLTVTFLAVDFDVNSCTSLPALVTL